MSAENKSAELYSAEQQIKRLESSISRLESELDDANDEIETLEAFPAAADDLIDFLESTARDYPTPELYARDLAEHIRLARA